MNRESGPGTRRAAPLPRLPLYSPGPARTPVSAGPNPRTCFRMATARVRPSELRDTARPGVPAGRAATGYETGSLTLAGGVGDEFGDFFGLLTGDDSGRHPAGRGAVNTVFDRVENAAFDRCLFTRFGGQAGRG